MINYDLFFLHEEDEHLGHDIILRNKGEVNHIVNVLRKKIGDRISLADTSHRFDVEITELSKSEIYTEIINTVGIETPNPKVLLYPALLKGAQFDLQIEKSVELGCHGFQPLITDRVIANKNKVEKWQDVIIKARKQCKQVHEVFIHEPQKILSLKKEANQSWIVPEIGIDTIEFDEVNMNDSTEICIFIGPEGGFSERELEHLEKQGATFHSLGDLRLRAETAAWKTITHVQLLIDKNIV